jgi:hypothetical protein
MTRPRPVQGAPDPDDPDENLPLCILALFLLTISLPYLLHL